MLSNSIQKKITEANNKIWQDRLVGIHRRDHTLRKNQNRPTIKNHAELLSCQIIHSSTYRQPLTDNPTAFPQTDTFLLNIPYQHTFQTIDGLPFSYLPITLSLQTRRDTIQPCMTKLADWNMYAKHCNELKINPHIQTTTDINTKIRPLRNQK